MKWHLTPGDIVDGKYRVVRILGEGGMSVVYAAEDVAGATPVAMKVLKEQATSSTIEDVIRFRREVEVVSKFDHPNIVKLYGAGELGDTPYLVTELLHGDSLADLIDQKRIFSRSDSVKIMLQVAEGLGYVHAQGIVHRDLKPGNIIVRWVDGAPQVKLLDFGLSLIVELGEIVGEAEVVGTFSYMSPEATGIVNKRVDERSDLYSLGIIFYRLISGVLPFKGRDVSTLLHQQVTLVPSVPSVLNPDVTEALDRIVMKLLNKEPDLRYQSAKGLIHDLRRVMKGESGFAIGEQDQKIKLTFQTRMIGRDRELEEITHRIRKAERYTGSTVLIAGEAGVGKSRLIEEVRAYAYRRDAMFIGARCTNQESKTPYQPFRDAINEYMKSIEHMEAGERAKEVERLREDLGDLGGVILKLNPRLGAILGECREPVALDPERENQRFLMVASRLFTGLAGRGAVAVLFVEDLHWADEGTLALLLEIHEIGADANLVVMASYRDDEIGEDHLLNRFRARSRDGDHLLEFKLQPLGGEYLRRVVASILGEKEDKATDLARFLFEKSGGNPFFAITILRECVEERALTWGEGAWTVHWDRLWKIPIPANVSDMILKRAKSLSPAANELLGVASVFGLVVDMNALYELVPREAEEVVRLVDEAIGMQFLIEDADRGRVFFAHDRVRDAFYRKLDSAERCRLHAAAGRFIERRSAPNLDDVIFDLVYHYREGRADDKVLEYVLPAARRAKAGYANDAALRYYQLAVELLEARDDRSSDAWVEAKEGLVEVSLMIGASNDAIAAARDILPLKKTALEKARIHYHIGNAWFKKGDWVQCEQAFGAGLALLGEKIPRTRPRVILSLAREIVFNVVRHNLLRDVVPRRMFPPKVQEEAKEICRITGQLSWMYILDDALKCMNLVFRSYNISHSRLGDCREKSFTAAIYAAIFMSIPMFSRSLKHHHKALAMRRAIGDEWGIGQCLQFLGFCHSLMSDYPKAVQSFQQSKDAFTVIGDMWEFGMVLDGWSRVYLYMGDYQKTVALTSQYQAISEKTANDFGVASAEALMAYAYVEKGQFVKAHGLARSALRRSGDHNIGVVHCFSLIHLGYLEIERGNFEDAIRHLEAAREEYESHMFIRDQTTFLYTLLAEAQLQRFVRAGRDLPAPERKRELRRIGAACRLAERKTRPWPNHHGRAVRICGEFYALTGRPRPAEKRFRQAVEQTGKIGRKFELAKSLLSLGCCLESTGRTDEAQAQISRARQLFKELGARHYMERAAGLMPGADDTASEESSRFDAGL